MADMNINQQTLEEAPRNASGHHLSRPEPATESVGDPGDILAFLNHNFELATKDDKDHDEYDEPIQTALCALAYASNDTTVQALGRFDPTQSPFVPGIRHVFKRDKPFRLHKAALLFLPHIADGWFNAPTPVMDPDGIKAFCADWASAVDEMGRADDVRDAALAVLLDMINSPYWRPHIVTDKWKLLEDFPSIPSGSQPLERCLKNPTVLGEISKGGNQDAKVLWLKVLLSKYKMLDDEVKKGLETVMRTIPRWELDRYLTTIGSELSRAEQELTKYTTWSTDPKAEILKKDIEGRKEAKAFLEGLKSGSLYR